MKKIKNNTAVTIVWLHGITLTLLSFLNPVFSQVLFPYFATLLNNQVLSILLDAVVSGVIYTLIYQIAKLVYEIIIFKIKDKRLDLSGKWYHLHIPYAFDEIDYNKRVLRAGVTEITREYFDYTFMGDNYSLEGTENGEVTKNEQNPTHWYTRATKLSDENDFDIIQIFEAKTRRNAHTLISQCPCCNTHFDEPVDIEEASFFRHGIHKLKLVVDTDGKCRRINGEYSDSWPSLKRGDILFFRNEADRDDVAEQYFAEAKRLATKKEQV